MNILNTTQRTRRILLSGFSILLLSATLPGGYAQADTDDVRQVKVSFAELDLSKPAGARVLYRRLQNAASRVCGARDSITYNSRSTRECYDTALSNAVMDVNSPLLSQIHGIQMERVARK